MTTSITGPQQVSEYASKGEPLSPREREVMNWLVLGMDNNEIAKAMSITHKGVESHLTNIRTKVGLGRRVLLALWWDHATKSG